MAEAGLLAGLELVVRLVLVLVQEVRSQGRREWVRKIGVDHNRRGVWGGVVPGIVGAIEEVLDNLLGGNDVDLVYVVDGGPRGDGEGG